MSSATSADLLWEYRGNLYHVLPGVAQITQEENMEVVPSVAGGGRSKKIIMQPDGSRFVCIKWAHDAIDLRDRIREQIPGRRQLLVETYFKRSFEAKDFLERYILRPDLGDIEYRLYWLHTFLNGRRFIPVIVLKKLQTFVYVGGYSFFPDNQPDDDFGILIENPDDGWDSRDYAVCKIGQHTFYPRIYDYRSFVRLCPCCGIVSDTSKSRNNPWKDYRQRVQNSVHSK